MATEVLREMVGQCLREILAQLDALPDAEAVHRLRIGIRRLRSALKLFGDGGPQLAGWDEALAAQARMLGRARDRDVLEQELLPQLKALGCPPLALPPLREEPGAGLRSRKFARLLRDLLGFANTPSMEAGSELVRARLKKFERRLRREAAGFATADEPARHRLRKRLKRLRYGIELAGVRKRRLAGMKTLQDALGRYNDMHQALLLFRSLQPQPGAWFATGWATARREELLRDALRAVEDWR
ncbi:CHAD domain-containing protein [Pelomonas sp. KK5]|uniref:CHAD domain-containing protein n=1 Tax=Pelomonas sp. KK5 TaxID=1855730 RepID=UPI00097C0783|nr:CHAD domain-containing protein [Pelomonas sp. KK5]